MKTAICKICQKEFDTYYNIYCSRECSAKAQSKPRVKRIATSCRFCGKVYQKRITESKPFCNARCSWDWNKKHCQPKIYRKEIYK